MVAVVGVWWILSPVEAAFFKELAEVAWRCWRRLVLLGGGGFCADECGRFHFQGEVDLSLGEHSFSRDVDLAEAAWRCQRQHSEGGRERRWGRGRKPAALRWESSMQMRRRTLRGGQWWHRRQLALSAVVGVDQFWGRRIQRWRRRPFSRGSEFVASGSDFFLGTRIPRRRLGAASSGWSHLECLGALSVFGGVDSFVGGGRVRREEG